MHVYRVVVGSVGRRRDGHRFTKLVQALAQRLNAARVATAQQVHHLELRTADGGRGGLGVRRGRQVLMPVRRTASQRGAHGIQQY